MDTLNKTIETDDIYEFLDGKSYYVPVFNSGGLITDKMSEVKILNARKHYKSQHYDFTLIGRTYNSVNLKQLLQTLKARNKPLYYEAKRIYPESFV